LKTTVLPRDEIEVVFEIILTDWTFEVNDEVVRSLRFYKDHVWELLNEFEQPIQQGWFKEAKNHSLAFFKNPVSTDKPEEKG